MISTERLRYGGPCGEDRKLVPHVIDKGKPGRGSRRWVMGSTCPIDTDVFTAIAAHRHLYNLYKYKALHTCVHKCTDERISKHMHVLTGTSMHRLCHLGKLFPSQILELTESHFCFSSFQTDLKKAKRNQT